MLLAILIGVILGFIGGGGSILAVPILVYVLEVKPVEATAYSLFIVGIASLFGAHKHYKLGNIDLKLVCYLLYPLLLVCFQVEDGCSLIIPEELFVLEIMCLQKDFFLMIFLH